MERIQHLRERFSISAQTHRRLAFAALVLLVLIVFTGSAVRLTGSGLGCPTWPKCTETSIHSELDVHGVIEFGNRVLTSLVSAGAIAAALGSFLRRPLHPLRRDLAWIGVLLPLGVVVQAVIGGLSVLYKLAPIWVITHYLVSMLLLIAAFALWWRSRLEPDEIAAVRSERVVVWAVRALCVYAFVAITAGTWATAAGPHAGSAGTGEFVHRLDFWGSETLSNLINTHGTLAAILGVATVACWALARARGGNAELLLTLKLTAGLMALQGVVGIAQYRLELPSEIVWVHVALATLTWVGFVHVWAAAGRSVQGPAEQPASPSAQRLVGEPVGS
jgi:cytochrome c oxidase assembly protein subunit 15